MSTLNLAFRRPTLADRLVSRSLATDLVLVAAGTAVTAVAAQLVFPLWPVPITGQTFAVLLVATVLGPMRGALSMVLYLILGVLGLPIFAAGGHGNILTSTSGGFVVGFIVSSVAVGILAECAWDHRVFETLVSFAAGTAIIYAFGLPWLFAVLSTFPATTMIRVFGTTNVLQATIVGGLVPFLLGDLIKAIVAAGLLPLSWKLINRTARD